MNDFLLIFRAEPELTPRNNPEAMQASMQLWMDWIGGIAAKGNLVDRGNRLENSGKVLRRDNMLTDGPYAEIKETIGGYTIIKANSYDEAVELAKGCPILAFGGNVEIREIISM